MNTHTSSYFILSIFLLLLSYVDTVTLPTTSPSLPTDIHDFQSRYALGLPLSYQEMDLIDLESIDGIGKETAWYLYMYQLEVLNASCEFAEDERWRGFQIIPGIGRKSAQKISEKISLQNYDC